MPHSPHCLRQRRQRAAFAIARVLVVDPVMRIDPLERNAVARPQHLHQDPPRRDLRLGGAARHVGIIAGEFHPDRIGPDHLVKGRAVVDVFVVVAVGAVGMGRDQVLRHRPVHRAVGFDPDGDAAPGRIFRLRLRAAARRAGRPLGLVHDDVVPGMGFRHIAPRRQPDHLQARECRACPTRARWPRGRAFARRPELRIAMAQSAVTSRRKFMVGIQ